MYSRNGLFTFLMSLFRGNEESVIRAFQEYFVGTTELGQTVFWQIDQRSIVRTGKVIQYDGDTGKRRKDRNPNWMHSILKKTGSLPNDFALKQCFFGEHLIRKYNDLPIAIVESEKTALVATICHWAFPSIVWIACGGKSLLTLQRLLKLPRDRQLVLYPDEDAFSQWDELGNRARRVGIDVRTSRLGEKFVMPTGWDIADLLFQIQSARNLERQPGTGFRSDSEEAREERLAIMTFEGGLSEAEAVDQIDPQLSSLEANPFTKT